MTIAQIYVSFMHVFWARRSTLIVNTCFFDQPYQLRHVRNFGDLSR